LSVDQTVACLLPVIHPAVDERVIHGVAHGQPVDGQVDRLKPRVFQYVWMLVSNEEANVLRQQASSEDRHNHDHHLHYLSAHPA